MLRENGRKAGKESLGESLVGRTQVGWGGGKGGRRAVGIQGERTIWPRRGNRNGTDGGSSLVGT
jgi:hypothetical protein